MAAHLNQRVNQLAVAGVVVSAGLLATSTSALAQIPVTGGRLTGEAAFFAPNTGNTLFFDLGTRTLRLNTPNGVTVDSRFSITSGGLEPIGNRFPRAGDRGSLTGVLSGRAFDQAGSPVFFSNVPTQLGFTVNQFAPFGQFVGTLIRPTTPQASANIFLPVTGVVLSPTSRQSFTGSPGLLAVGGFDASLPTGTIGLPNTLRFGTPLVSEFAVPDTVIRGERRLNFSLNGVGIPNPPGTIGDPLGSFFDPFFAGGVRFSSANATTNFNIQLEGTPLSITGSGNAATLIEIQGINPASSASTFFLPGTNPAAPAVSYSVVGTGSGSVSNSEPLRFSSINSSTRFTFQDAMGNTAQGISLGVTNFAIAGAQPFTVSSFSNLTPSPSINAIAVDNVGRFVPAPVTPPPALFLPGTSSPLNSSSSIDPQLNYSGTTTAQNTPASGASENSVPGFNTTTLPPITALALASNPRLAIVPSPQGTTMVMVPNRALPGSVVFPGLNATRMPLNSVAARPGNAIDRLLSGQNLTVQDTLNLVTGDLNTALGDLSAAALITPAPTSNSVERLLSGQNLTVQDTVNLGTDLNSYLGNLARTMPVDTPASPLAFPLTSNNSIATDSRLNIGSDILSQLGTGNVVSSSMTSFLDNLNQQMSTGLDNPEDQARRNQRLTGLVGAELAGTQLTIQNNRRNALRQTRKAESEAEFAEWRARDGLPADSGLQLGPD